MTPCHIQPCTAQTEDVSAISVPSTDEQTEKQGEGGLQTGGILCKGEEAEMSFLTVWMVPPDQIFGGNDWRQEKVAQAHLYVEF